MAQPTSSLLTNSGHQKELSMSDAVILSSTPNGSYTETSHANGHGTSPSGGQKQRGGKDPRNPKNRDAAGKSKPVRQISFGRGVTVPDGKVYETLQRAEAGERGPKTRRNRKKHGCLLGLSKASWLFLLLALAQALLVFGLQTAIAILGQFRSTHLNAYVTCLEDSLNNSIDIPDNATFPSFGRDKEIYIYFFIALMVYSFALCLYALIFQNIVEIYTFLIINILAMAYASVQVYQFRGFGSECATITLVGWLAFANVMILLIFTIVFAFLSFFIYVEFGWKIYTLVNCNSTIRYYYRVYEVFLSGVKLLILFTVIFSIGQCILLLQGNYEFGLTILLAIFAIVVYAFAYYGVRHESFWLSLGLLVVNLLTIGYFTFKIYRYASLTCPLCEDAVAERDEAVRELRIQLQDTVEDVSFLNRVEEFEHLLMIGAMNLITAVIVLLIFLHLWRQYGKGLKDYFSKQPPLFNCKWCQHCDEASESTDSDGAPHSRGMILRLWSSSKRKKRKSEDSKRDSGLQETYSPMEPEFNPALPTNPGFTRDIERGTPGKYTRTALPSITEESGDSAFS